jgi:hypothetical protein
MPGGGATIIHPDGRRWVVDSNNNVRAFTRPGFQATYSNVGKVNMLHVVRPNDNMLVLRSSRGERETVALRPAGLVVVTYGNGRGFTQRPIPGRNGYFQRTYVANGQTYTRTYRGYRYGGVIYFRYAPSQYYSPQFYAWAQRPWRRSVAYNWGQGQAPWLGFFSNYFTPAGVYPTASSWLTDFVISADLKTAYQDRQEYEQGNPNEQGQENSTLNPQIKGAISQEVAGEVQSEQTASALPAGQVTPGDALPPALDPNQRTFVMSQSLDVPLGNDTCTLTSGDVVSRTNDNLLPGNKVAVNVVSGKPGDCPVNTATQIDVVTLQEMHNQFVEQVDAGLGTLASDQGGEGLPTAPAADARPSVDAAAQPDPNAEVLVAEQQNDADAAEAAATQAQGGAS